MFACLRVRVKKCAHSLATPAFQKTSARNHGATRVACRALPELQRIDLAQVQRVQRVRLLLRGLRGRGDDALLCGHRLRVAPRVAARGRQPRPLGRTPPDAAVGAGAAERGRRAAPAVAGAPPGGGALPPRAACLPARVSGVCQDRLWRVRRAHPRVALLVRLPAAKLPLGQDEPGGGQDRGQHGHARLRADGRGGHRLATAARRERSGQAAGGDPLGLRREAQRGLPPRPRHKIGGAL